MRNALTSLSFFACLGLSVAARIWFLCRDDVVAPWIDELVFPRNSLQLLAYIATKKPTILLMNVYFEYFRAHVAWSRKRRARYVGFRTYILAGISLIHPSTLSRKKETAGPRDSPFHSQLCAISVKYDDDNIHCPISGPKEDVLQFSNRILEGLGKQSYWTIHITSYAIPSA